MTTENEHGPGSEFLLKKEKYFLKEEIIKRIELVAKGSGLESGDLQLELGKEKYDSKWNLLYLTMQVVQEKAREKKCGNIWYVYLVKGEHGPVGASETTCIMKADSTMTAPDEVDFAQIVLEYNDAENKWV